MTSCRSMPATFLVLSVAIVPTGPESRLNGASVPPRAGRPARGRPTRAAGRQGPTLPVPAASVPRGRERGGGPSRQAPIYVPQGRAAQLGEEAGEALGHTQPCAAASVLPTSSPSELELSAEPLWPSCSVSNRPSWSSPHLLPFPRLGGPLSRISPPFIPCFICLYSGCCCHREAVPDTPV